MAAVAAAVAIPFIPILAKPQPTPPPKGVA